jgi:hypothetical protein
MKLKGSVKALPVFRGYAVDLRLKEFRKLELGKSFQVIPFATPDGDELLTAWMQSEPDISGEELIMLLNALASMKS